MPFPIITAIAAETSTIAVNHPQTIDFSTLDTIAGAVIAVAAMIVVGLILLKFKVIKVGYMSEENGYSSISSVEKRRAERVEIKSELNGVFESLKEAIDNIRNDLKEYNKEHQECQRNLPEKYVQWDILNRMLDELKKDRKERWDKFDQHTHDGHSGVVLMRRVV